MTGHQRKGKSGYRLRDGLRLLRVTALVGLLMGVATLKHWSHRGDPRFFAFVNSPLGSTCARAFGWWTSPLEQPVADKPDQRLTHRERAVREAIQHSVDRVADAGSGESATSVYQAKYRDVAFRLEYPDQPLYLYPPYAIISELPPADMDRTMTAVSDVYDGFWETFGTLLTRAPSDELIHLLYFASEASYLDYQREYADALENTSGFYSPARNRLVLYRDPAVDENISLLTIRHEAAHQLFYTYGIHSGHRIENEWLIEGLASYCETPRVGGVDGNQAVLLQHALADGRLIPIDELVNHRNDRGLLAYKPAELAYAESWSLVHFLMQAEHRGAFFAYIRYIRDPASYRSIRDEARVDILCRYLGQTPARLQADWEAHLRDLAAPRVRLPGPS